MSCFVFLISSSVSPFIHPMCPTPSTPRRPCFLGECLPESARERFRVWLFHLEGDWEKDFAEVIEQDLSLSCDLGLRAFRDHTFNLYASQFVVCADAGADLLHALESNRTAQRCPSHVTLSSKTFLQDSRSEFGANFLQLLQDARLVGSQILKRSPSQKFAGEGRKSLRSPKSVRVPSGTSRLLLS